MGWNYSGPSASDKDAVRFLIGDTDVDDQLLSDEEINYLVDTWLPVHGTIFYVSSIACETIAARMAREISYSADGVSVSLSELQSKFELSAETLRQQHKELLVGGAPDVGGISAYGEPDMGLAPFIFGTGMGDNLEAGRQDYGNRSAPDFFPENYPG
jgi:hypothetical protein